MITRTWPYGTRKSVEVADVIPVEGGVIVCAETGVENPEGFVLMGAKIEGVSKGDKGFITFREGGPMGGFWEFSKS